MVRDANLQEVRDQIGELRSLNVRGQIEKVIDADGSLRSTLASNPLAPEPTIAPMVSPTPAPVAPVEVTELVAATPVAAAAIEAPAFIPPSAVPAPPAPVEEPPAFIPPGATRA
jgi:sec-independent protein translocase protein TatB